MRKYVGGYFKDVTAYERNLSLSVNLLLKDEGNWAIL